jgi:hypothetical protein
MRKTRLESADSILLTAFFAGYYRTLVDDSRAEFQQNLWIRGTKFLLPYANQALLWINMAAKRNCPTAFS